MLAAFAIFVVWLVAVVATRSVETVLQLVIDGVFLLSVAAIVLFAAMCRAMSNQLHVRVRLRNFPPLYRDEFAEWCARNDVPGLSDSP
jgi:hypothetical protein